MKFLTVAAILLGASSPSFAQSKIQCEVGVDGQYAAVQIWQNTLGESRANDICRQQMLAKPVANEQDAQIAVARGTLGQKLKGRFDSKVYAKAMEKTSDLPRKQGGTAAVAVDESLAIPEGYVSMW